VSGNQTVTREERLTLCSLSSTVAEINDNSDDVVITHSLDSELIDYVK